MAQPIFPTFVWAHDLKAEIAEPLNARLAQALDLLTQPRPALPPGQTWQTDQTLHTLPEFEELTKAMLFASGEVMRVMEIEQDGFEITGCWANLCPSGGAHMPHHHPNNYLSGVYYVAAAKGGDAISFHEPRNQVDVISPRLRRMNQYNSPIHTLPIQPGRLVLFPSWLVHSVPPNTSNALRISVSFNVMFSSYAETVSQPKWKGLPLNITALRAGMAGSDQSER